MPIVFSSGRKTAAEVQQKIRNIDIYQSKKSIALSGGLERLFQSIMVNYTGHNTRGSMIASTMKEKFSTCNKVNELLFTVATAFEQFSHSEISPNQENWPTQH